MGTTKKDDKLMGKPTAPAIGVSPNQALIKYVADLSAEYGGYARVLGDVRNIIDRAMGEQTLTGLLYKSRSEDAWR